MHNCLCTCSISMHDLHVHTQRHTSRSRILIGYWPWHTPVHSSRNTRQNWSQKSRKCAFYCLPYYLTRYQKKIWPKTARNSPYFLPFLLGQKNVKKHIIISDNVLLLYLYLSSVLSLFLSRMKYLNPGFESVVKSYLARRTKTLPRLVVARL